MFFCFQVFVSWVVWYSGLLWLVVLVVVSRCDLMCKLIRLHTRGCVGSQIRLVACLSIGKHNPPNKDMKTDEHTQQRHENR